MATPPTPTTGALTVNATTGVILSPVTAALFKSANGIGSGSGTVTSVSVVTANGFAGSVATGTTTPAITLTTTIAGLLKGNGTAISAATSGTDYAPATTGSFVLTGNGAGGFTNTDLTYSTPTLSVPDAFVVSSAGSIGLTAGGSNKGIAATLTGTGTFSITATPANAGSNALTVSNILTGTSGGATLTAFNGDVQSNQSAGTGNNVFGVNINTRNVGASTIPLTTGFRSISIIGSSGGNITEAACYSAKTPSVSGSGIIATAYAYYAEAQKTTGVTTGYAFYGPGANDTSFLAGNLRFGNATTGTNLIDSSGAFTLTGGAGNMTFVAGTGNSRTLTFQTTTSGGTARTGLSIDNIQQVIMGPGSGSANAYSLLTGGTSESWAQITNSAVTTGQRSWRLGTAASAGGGFTSNSFGLQRMADNFGSITDTVFDIVPGTFRFGTAYTVNFASGAINFTGATTVTGGAGNMTVVAGTGNSRTLTLQTTTSGGTATNAVVFNATQQASFTSQIAVNGATASTSTGLILSAGTTAISPMRIPSGVAPTSPVSGDFWYDGTNLKFRDGTTTRTLTWV